MPKIEVRLTLNTDTGEVSNVRVEKPKNTKIANATEFYRKNPNMSRLDMLDVFVSEFGMTPDGARTYYQTVSSEAKRIAWRRAGS
jgi:hypothetical protein